MKRIYLNTLTPEEIIKRLKAGEVVRCDCDDEDPREVILIDGFVVKKYLARGKSVFEISSGIYIDKNDDYYFEEPEEFKVEEAGKYLTRDGRIAFVSYIYNNKDDGYFCRGIITGDNKITEWGLNGKLLGTLQNISDEDLVEYAGD